MRLHRLKVEHVRGLASADVSFAAEGVTVIEAPNESGKTTLFDALDLLLTERDSTTKRQVRDLQPVGRDVGSLVEAELTCGGIHLTVRKRFNKDRLTELEIHAPNPQQSTGDEAHGELCRILGEHTDLVLYEALRFRQGRSLDRVLLGESSHLAARLDEIAGGQGDRADDVLLERVRAEFARYHTPSGQPGRAIKESHAAVEAAEDRVRELTARVADIQRDADALSDLEREQRRRRSSLSELEPLLDGHLRRRDRVRTVREELATREARAQLADLERDRLQAARSGREALVATITSRRGVLSERSAEVGEARARLEAIEEALTVRADAVATAEEEEREARQRLTAVRAAASLGRARAELGTLVDRQARIDAALDAAATAEAALAAEPLTAEQLDEIRAADEALRLALARLGDAAPVLTVRALERAVPLTVDGAPLRLAGDEVFEHAVPDRAVVRVADLVEFEVGAGSSLADRQAEVDEARRRASRACEVVGLPDRDAAERRAEARRGYQRALDERDSSVARELAGATRDELVDRIRATTTEIARLEAELVPTGTGPQLALDMAAAADELSVRESAEAHARDRAEQARSEHRELSVEVGRLHRDLQTELAEVEAEERQLAILEDQLAAERAARSDAELASALDAADGAARDAAAAVRATHEELSELDADEVELLAANAEQQMLRGREELTRISNEITQRRTRIEVRGGDGVGERLLAAEAELARVCDTHERLLARAEAARTLHEAFERAREAAYAAYREPLRERVVRTGRIVFNDTLDVEFDEELRIVSRRLDGSVLEWERLSAGAREQLAILTALAAADLAGGDGEQGVPLVLDDTLGYTDPRRLERLCAVLGRVRGPQVIVLSCVGARFEGVGAASVVRLRDATAA
jgi:hypothetical protein